MAVEAQIERTLLKGGNFAGYFHFGRAAGQIGVLNRYHRVRRGGYNRAGVFENDRTRARRGADFEIGNAQVCLEQLRLECWAGDVKLSLREAFERRRRTR